MTLFVYSTPRNGVSESGTLDADSDAFQGSTTTSQQQLKDFMRAMRTGEIYVNIHTEQNPDGENPWPSNQYISRKVIKPNTE